MKWLYRILRLFWCPHKWEVFKKNTFFHKGSSSEYPVRMTFTLSCKRCGKIREMHGSG